MAASGEIRGRLWGAFHGRRQSGGDVGTDAPSPRAKDDGNYQRRAASADGRNNMTYLILLIVVILVLGAAALSVGILEQYERGVQFRLGRVKDGARGPGLIFIVPSSIASAVSRCGS